LAIWVTGMALGRYRREARTRIRLSSRFQPPALPGAGHHAGKCRLAWRYPPAEPGAERDRTRYYILCIRREFTPTHASVMINKQTEKTSVEGVRGVGSPNGHAGARKKPRLSVK
jgi:hypothetical protein